jgi:uroporphyrin-3 C-methyltransferase
MSDETEKEGVVIDVTPDQEETPEEKPQPDPKSQKTSSAVARLPLILAVIALLLVVGVMIAAFQYTRQAADELAAIDARLTQSLQAQQAMENQLAAADAAAREQAARLREQQALAEEQQQTLAAARERFDRQEQLLDSERLKMQQREAELRASVADVHRRVGASGTQWLVAEAEYLMRVANQRLALARDTETAHTALELADQRLRDTQDPGWNPVRDQLAREMAALDAAGTPDAAGLSARLHALAEQVPQLQLANATLGGTERTPHDGSTPQATPRPERNWDTLLDDLWAGFKETVRIRRNDKPVAAMLAPEQQYFLYENLRLHLESARLAVVRADRELYRDSLNTVASWISNYFDNTDQLTRATQKSINQLLSIDVRPPLPDISQSLRSLQMRRKLNADLAGTPPAMAREATLDEEPTE